MSPAFRFIFACMLLLPDAVLVNALSSSALALCFFSNSYKHRQLLFWTQILATLVYQRSANKVNQQHGNVTAAADIGSYRL